MTTNEPRVPDQGKLKSVQALCEISHPYDHSPESDKLFVSAMKEIIAWHSEHNNFFARLLELTAFKADELVSSADCAKIPFVPARFKFHVELSVPREDITLHFTSSGTTGQKSQMFHDDWTQRSGRRMVDFIYDFNSWRSETPVNYLLYAYESEPDSKVGTVLTNNMLMKYAPANRVFSALRRTGTGSHEFDVYGCIDRLVEYEKEGKPVRIFGFPAFLHFTLERMRALKLPALKLSPDSFVSLGGGWKGNVDKAIDKLELYRAINEQLGIPDRRIRDGFGSVEHCIPYSECAGHQFHVPTWSRVFIRDVKTLAPLAAGEKGFLHFVTPFITSTPAVSMLMGDLGSWHEANTCSCGLQTPYFVVHGRAGLSRNKSCAIAASELLNKERKRS